jgi:hypothetical protein
VKCKEEFAFWYQRRTQTHDGASAEMNRPDAFGAISSSLATKPAIRLFEPERFLDGPGRRNDP